jgi:hypothetical protein
MIDQDIRSSSSVEFNEKTKSILRSLSFVRDVFDKEVTSKISERFGENGDLYRRSQQVDIVFDLLFETISRFESGVKQSL